MRTAGDERSRVVDCHKTARRPSLEQLKKRAREIRRELGIRLSGAQFHLAQGYGFASWPKLKAHVEMVNALTREPDAVAAVNFLSLAAQAAATGPPDALRLAVKHGFDVNALGRADAPVEQPWQTALHSAVERSDQAMVDVPLELGADPSIEDARFNATRPAEPSTSATS